jgi:uncharacterized protein
MRPWNRPSTRWSAAWLLTSAVLLGACASPPAPAVRLHRLALQTEGVRPPSATVATFWELRAVQVPGYLDRRALLVRDGDAALTALDNDRWAEPLREAVPRVLRADLEGGLGVGAVLWRPDTTARAQASHLLDVEILQLDADPQGPAALLKARWQLRPRSASGLDATATWQEGDWTVAARSAMPSDLVRAQREALAALARRILARAAP